MWQRETVRHRHRSWNYVTELQPKSLRKTFPVFKNMKARRKRKHVPNTFVLMLQKEPFFLGKFISNSHCCSVENPVVHSIRPRSLVALHVCVSVCWMWLEAVEFRVVLFWPCSLTPPSM